MVRLTFPEIFSLLGAQVAEILTNVTFCDTQTHRQTDRQTHRHSVNLYKIAIVFQDHTKATAHVQ